jgi:hypothetical protein
MIGLEHYLTVAVFGTVCVMLRNVLHRMMLGPAKAMEPVDVNQGQVVSPRRYREL